MRKVILIAMSFLMIGCVLSKEERQNKRANRKLERLTDKYPQLLDKDTLRDTVTILVPEIEIDTFIQTNTDVSGVDSILNKFNDKLDSLTRIEVGDEIKYYITKRQVIEDTIIHKEDGVTVSIWQEDELIRVKVEKPEEEVTEVVENIVDVVRPAEIPKWKLFLQQVNQFAIPLIILLVILWGIIRVIKFYFTRK